MMYTTSNNRNGIPHDNNNKNNNNTFGIRPNSTVTKQNANKTLSSDEIIEHWREQK